jgi:peptide/nickel transport system substrate-binding protein
MKRTKAFSGFVLVMTFLLIFTGVIRAQDESRVLRVAMTQEPGIIIDYFTDLGVSWTHSHLHSQQAWGADVDGNVIPLLVDELPSEENGGISMTEDGKSVIKFTIADWAVWSDGTPITADDFVLVYDISSDGISNMIPLRFVNGAALDGVTAGESDKEVVITFSEGQPDWTSAGFYPLPAHILRAPYEEALADGIGFDDSQTEWLRAPAVSNGPFVFAEWQAGSYIRYVRNPNYWDDVWFDEVIFSLYGDNNVIKELLVAGETDWTFVLGVLEAIEFKQQNPDMNVLTSFGGGRMELQFNFTENRHPALADVNVRRAIAMAIDRQFIVDELYDGQTEIPKSFWYGTPWYYEGTPQIEYDPEGAAALLEEAGWYDEDGDGVIEAHGVEGVEDGTPLALTAATYAGGGFTEYQDVLLTVQDFLKDAGIDVSISQYEVNVMHSSLTDNSPFSTAIHDLYVLGWGVGTDTIDQYELWGCSAIPTEDTPTGLNGAGICYPEMDELWNILGTSMSAEERQEAANQIQELIANEVMMVSMVNLNSVFVTSPSLIGGEWGRGNSPWYSVHGWERAS